MVSAYAVKTKIFEPGDSLTDFCKAHLTGSLENSLLVVTSKIVSLAEGQLRSFEGNDRKELVRAEADRVLGEVHHNHTITLKHGLLVPGAGIDTSNSRNLDYILYPLDPWGSARTLGHQLKAALGLENFGVLITDSHSIPMRRGVIGVALSYWGFRGVRNYIGEPDLFGRPLKFTKQNLADAYAALAVSLMGEASECQPLAVVNNPQVEFFDGDDRDQLQVQPEEDLYLRLLNLK